MAQRKWLQGFELLKIGCRSIRVRIEQIEFVVIITTCRRWFIVSPSAMQRCVGVNPDSAVGDSIVSGERITDRWYRPTLRTDDGANHMDACRRSM
jgi:hypothetical protein